MTDRMDRLSKMILREVSIILEEDINDPRIRHVTISKVELARDLKSARIFYTLPPEETDKQEVSRGLKSAGSYIRGELARRVVMKFSPRITFIEDITEEKKEALDDIFGKISREHRMAEGQEEERTDDEKRNNG